MCITFKRISKIKKLPVDGRVSVFRASSGLEPSVFLHFGLRAGSDGAKFASGVWEGGYLYTFRYLIWVSSLFEPTTFFGFWALGGQNLLWTGERAETDTRPITNCYHQFRHILKNLRISYFQQKLLAFYRIF